MLQAAKRAGAAALDRRPSPLPVATRVRPGDRITVGAVDAGARPVTNSAANSVSNSVTRS
jgi:hypothetical protein